MKFGINFTSCSENGNFAIITTSGIYPKISLMPVISQINTTAYFVKVKISDFQTRFHDDCALLTPARHAVSWKRADSFVHRVEADSLSS